MNITYNKNRTVRTFEDSHNPRIYRREYECAACHAWVEEDDVVWIDPKTGKASTGDEANAYCVGCVPEEGDTYKGAI